MLEPRVETLRHLIARQLMTKEVIKLRATVGREFVIQGRMAFQMMF